LYFFPGYLLSDKKVFLARRMKCEKSVCEEQRKGNGVQEEGEMERVISAPSVGLALPYPLSYQKSGCWEKCEFL
jgi:hypothetical protein